MLRITSLSALLALALAVPAAAQEAGPGADTAAVELIPSDSVQTAIQRFQSLQQRVQQVQTQVLQANPELQTRQAAIQQDVQAAVFEAHPDLEQAVEERMPVIQQEAQTAQASQDTAALQSLQQEYNGIMERLQEAQARVTGEEPLKSRLETFQDEIMSQMVEIDPEVESMMEEARRLAARLDATLGG